MDLSPSTFWLLPIFLPSQVTLCFSPVGPKLRVRSRKFPAIVNCTAINWFHEWPEDALVSVSARFLEDTEGIQVSLGAQSQEGGVPIICLQGQD